MIYRRMRRNKWSKWSNKWSKWSSGRHKWSDDVVQVVHLTQWGVKTLRR